MANFKPVSSQVNLPELEEETNKFWKENKIFEKSLENREGADPFIFVDGPPFVSGNPHYGHLLTSIAKDLVPRYQTMVGKKVRRVWGWDCHGLPVEDKVNQKLGIKSSKQLEEEFGIERYIQECRTYVEGVTSDWRWYVERIGRWVDMDNAYYTMYPEYMESVIWAFKQIYEKGLIYKGKRVSLFSTDTSTPVSEFEVAMDADNYRDIEDLSIFIKFKLKDNSKLNLDVKSEVFLVAWTTTPWTILANFALAVNENFDYSLVEYENEFYIVSKDRIGYTFNLTDQNKDLVKVIKEFKGKDLEGIEYYPAYENFKDQKTENDFKVYLSDDVTSDEGTGVLHIAPAFGEVDFNLGQKNNLSAISNIDEEGKLVINPWKGIYLRDASPLVTEDLLNKGLLLRSEIYKHRLPFYRGQNPLIYMAQDAYFINIQKIKGRMLELNEKINWIPKHIKKGRFEYTIESSPDWCISRNRYWATIIPIWKAEDGEELVIGSFEEMVEFTDQIEKKEIDGKIKYFFEDIPMDLHRDVCDKIILKKDGKEFKRIPEVLDVWMDSGSVPFAEYHYPFENKEAFEKGRPADFIIEYVPQVRAWFSMLHRVSTMLFDDVAFKNAICHGTIAGNDGRKMSKSFGNYPDPKDLLEKYGADALRLYLMGSPIVLGEDMNFNEEVVAENYKFLLTLWNSYKFFLDYAVTFNWDCNFPGNEKTRENLNVLDRWILSKLSLLTINIKDSLDSYKIPEAVKSLKEFIVNDYSTWYIRRSRDRVSSNENINDRNTCLSVMYGVLICYSKLAAPVTPFITEQIYKGLVEDLSVHLTDFPKGDASLINKELNEAMERVRKVVEAGHAKRKEANIKLRQPLASLTYESNQKLSEDLEQILADEVNVKKIEYRKGSVDHLHDGSIKLDTNITPELKEEGEVRDLIREIQQLRKEQNLTLGDKTEIEAPSWSQKFEPQILRGTASVSIKKGPQLKVTKLS